MLKYSIHRRKLITDEFSTRNPLKINVNTQKTAETKLAIPK